MNENAIVKQQAPEDKALTKIQNYLDAPMIKARFAQMMGERGASSYIASGLLAVADSKALQQCQPVSIYTQLLRAATLRLSVDPGIGQAYLVPFGSRATLIVGYKGLYDMAIRTGKYRYINVGPVYQGEIITENRITGFHKLEGGKTGKEVIGWLGAFEMTNGYAKTFYMTVEEIHEHGKKYSKSYDRSDSLWKSDPRKMERKTVLRLMLRRWGYIDPSDAQVLEEVDQDQPETVEAEFNSLADGLDKREPEEEAPKMSREQALTELGFPPDKDAEQQDLLKYQNGETQPS